MFVVFGPPAERLQLIVLSSWCHIIIIVLWKIFFCSICSSFTPFHLPLWLSIVPLRFDVNFRIQCFIPVNWKRASWDWGLLSCPWCDGLQPPPFSQKVHQVLSAWAWTCPEKLALMHGLFWHFFCLHVRQLSKPYKNGGDLPSGAQPVIHLAILWHNNISTRDAVIKGNCVFYILLQPFPLGLLLCPYEAYRECDNPVLSEDFPCACVQSFACYCCVVLCDVHPLNVT